MKFPKSILSVSMILLLNTTFSYAFDGYNKADTTKRPAPEISLIDIGGNNIKPESLKGKVTIINFWGIKCKPCVKEIPKLNSLVKDYKNQEIVFVAIASDSKDELNKFLKKRSFNYTHCSVTSSQYVELQDAFNKGYIAMPLHFIIDKDWQIVYMLFGELKGENLKAFKSTIDKKLDLY